MFQIKVFNEGARASVVKFRLGIQAAHPIGPANLPE
jgi:hypothetical protein